MQLILESDPARILGFGALAARIGMKFRFVPALPEPLRAVENLSTAASKTAVTKSTKSAKVPSVDIGETVRKLYQSRFGNKKPAVEQQGDFVRAMAAKFGCSMQKIRAHLAWIKIYSNRSKRTAGR